MFNHDAYFEKQAQNQQALLNQPLRQSQRPVRPYKINKQCDDLVIDNEPNDQSPFFNKKSENEDLFPIENNPSNHPPSFLRRNLAQTTRNSNSQIKTQKKLVNLYEEKDNNNDNPPVLLTLDHHISYRNSALGYTNPLTGREPARPTNMSSMNARARLAEQQRLRSTQPRKHPAEVQPLEQQMCYSPDNSEARKLELITPINSDLFYDPTSKPMENSDLPELTTQHVFIKSREEELQFENPRQQRYRIQNDSSVQELPRQSRDQPPQEGPESPLENFEQPRNQGYKIQQNDSPVQELRNQYQDQQHQGGIQRPLENFGRATNDIFKVKHETIRFQDLPLNSEAVNEEVSNKKDIQTIESKQKEQVNSNKQEDEVKAASNPNQLQRKPTFSILKLNLKEIPDMKAFLMSPCPQGSRMQCSIRRDRSGLNRFYPKYHCLLSDGLHYMMTAKKRAGNRTSNYLIAYSQKELKKNSQYHLGKLRSNYLGTEFNIYDTGKNPSKTSDIDSLRSNMGVILYEENVISGKNTGNKRVYIPDIDPNTSQPYQFRPLNGQDNLYDRVKSARRDGIKEFVDKKPKWSDEHKTYVLEFGGRAKLASVKNFQLVDNPLDDHIFFQLGKVTENTYILDFEWPLSPFQAFAFALSSFDYKLACE